MKKNITHLPTRTLLAAAGLALAVLTAPAALIDQTINMNAAGPTNVTGWATNVWGTSAALPTAGNDYRVPSGFTCRTPNLLTGTVLTFAGDTLICTNGGVISLKHGNAPAVANILLGPGTIRQDQGPTGTTNCPLAGTLQVVGNGTLSSGTVPGPRHIWLQSTLTGTGNLTVNMGSNNVLYLSANAGGYSGNWNLIGNRIEVWSGTLNPFGSGSINLTVDTNTVTFNSTNDLTIPNSFTGAGGLIKLGTNTITLSGSSSYSGSLVAREGTLILTGSGNQSSTTVNSNAILRVASSSALGSGQLTIAPNNELTGRLELSNNVTVQTLQQLVVAMRNNPTPAIVNVSGNNTIADQVAIQSGGGQLYLEAAGGTTLNLAGGVTSIASANRNFTLRGAGNGTIAGDILNGSASALTLAKDGTGTWELTGAFNDYTGETIVSNGVLRVGAGSSLGNTFRISLEEPGHLNTAPAGGVNVTGKTLRGRGAVSGNVTTGAGTVIDVGYTGQYGNLYLSNNLTLGGNDLIRFDLTTETNDILHVSGSLTLNGTTTNFIALPASFVDNGTYRLINYSGTLLGGGSFALVAPVSRQTFTLDTSTPGQVNLVVTGNPTNLVWSGDNSLNYWDVGTTANWNNQTEVFYNADNVRFDDTGSNVPDVFLPVAVTVSSMTVSNITKDYTVSGDFGIGSPGSLTKQGAGKLTLANSNNAFSGPISVQAGTLQLGNGGTAGSLGNGPVTLASGTTLQHLKTDAGTTLNGNIGGAGQVRVLGGTLQLAGTNTFTGPATVETGDITIRNNSALGDPATGTTVLPGGSVRVASLGNWVIPEPVTLAGIGYDAFPGALYVNTVSNRVTWTGPVTLSSNAMIRVVNNYAQLTLSNSLTASQKPLAVQIEGTGTRLVFAGAFNIGNAVTLTKGGAGDLVLAGGTNLAGATEFNGGGALVIATPTPPDIGDITINSGNLLLGAQGLSSFPLGQVNLVPAASRVVFNATNDFTVNSRIVGVGALIKTNDNLVTITSSNTFTGGITTGNGTPSGIGTSGGRLRLEHDWALGDTNTAKVISLIRAELQLVGNRTLPATFTCELSGGSFITTSGAGLIPIRSLSGNNVVHGPIRLIGGAGDSEISVDSGTLTLNGEITDNATSIRRLYLAGAGTGIVNGAIVNGPFGVALTKWGSGTWTLNNTASYTGTTLVHGGTLVLGAAAAPTNSSLVELRSNAVLNVTALVGGLNLSAAQTLQGAGTIQGNVTANGPLVPGVNGIGTLNVTGTATLAGTSTFELNRSLSPNADLLAAAAVVCGGNLVVTNIGANLQGGEQFNLFDGAISGTFASVTLPPLSYNTNLTWDTSALYTTGILKVAGGVATPPTLTGPALSGTNLVFSASTESGFNYILESTPVLNPATWTGRQTNAGGGTLNFTIPVVRTNRTEFFRLRVQ